MAPVEKRYVFFHRPAVPVPLFLESVGMNPHQEDIVRLRGYGHFHWLQTLSGVGEVEVAGARRLIGPREGFLVGPGVPHSYRALEGTWSTAYLTFHGDLAFRIVECLGLESSSFYRWGPEVPLEPILQDLLDSALGAQGQNPWEDSAVIYRFLTLLKTVCGTAASPTLEHRLQRLQPLFDLLEARYADPDFNVATMAGLMSVSSRHLGDLFRAACGDTPYQYLVKLRVRKAKELLTHSRTLTVKQVSARVGFRDASHFVATFRNLVGTPPDYFRRTMNESAPASKVNQRVVVPEGRADTPAAPRTRVAATTE